MPNLPFSWNAKREQGRWWQLWQEFCWACKAITERGKSLENKRLACRIMKLRPACWLRLKYYQCFWHRFCLRQLTLFPFPFTSSFLFFWRDGMNVGRHLRVHSGCCICLCFLHVSSTWIMTVQYELIEWRCMNVLQCLLWMITPAGSYNGNFESAEIRE